MKLFFTSQDGCLNPPGENKKGADTAGNSGCAPKRRDKLAKTPRQINRETHRKYYSLLNSLCCMTHIK